MTDITPTSSFRMLKAMVGIGAICGLLIVVSYQGTLPRIEQLKAESLQNAIFKVLPGITETQGFVYSDNHFIPTNEQTENMLYAGYDKEGKLVGIAIAAAGQGYADVIRILYGYDPVNQKVIGFYVLESKETPGLGDKIEKDQKFLDNFIALDVLLVDDQSAVKNKVITVKSGSKSNDWEVDGITGATISSRAIGNIIASSSDEWLPIIYKNQSDFLKRNND